MLKLQKCRTTKRGETQKANGCDRPLSFGAQENFAN